MYQSKSDLLWNKPDCNAAVGLMADMRRLVILASWVHVPARERLKENILPTILIINCF